MLIRLIKTDIFTLGPGKRTVVWTMGCHHACFNCIAQNLWPFDSNYEMPLTDVFAKIMSSSNKKVTFTGGEPFAQKEFPQLLSMLKEAGFNDILVYTGYTFEQIMKNNDYKNALKFIDILIDGKYIEKLNDNKSLRGSSNQRIIVLNNSLISDYQEEIKKQRVYQIEIVDNKLNIYGLVPKGFNKDDIFNKNEIA